MKASVPSSTSTPSCPRALHLSLLFVALRAGSSPARTRLELPSFGLWLASSASATSLTTRVRPHTASPHALCLIPSFSAAHLSKTVSNHQMPTLANLSSLHRAPQEPPSLVVIGVRRGWERRSGKPYRWYCMDLNVYQACITTCSVVLQTFQSSLRESRATQPIVRPACRENADDVKVDSRSARTLSKLRVQACCTNDCT